MKHTIAEQNKYLRLLGFRFPSLNPVRRNEAIKQFQNLVGLVPDGKYGVKTTFKMVEVLRNDCRVSDNFRFIEFQCKCGGKYSSCRGIKLDPKLVNALELIRFDYYPTGLEIVSAYRCPGHNKAAGGAKASMHLTGKAADIPAKVSHKKDFPNDIHGIGYNRKDGKVRHVDTRPGTRKVWVY